MFYESFIVLTSLLLGYVITKFFSNKLNGHSKPKARVV
jgi:hypothetical protein